MAVATKSGIYNGYKVIGTQTLGLRGLVLWLKFNEGSGNIAYDSSFYNNHGTIYGAVYTDGKFGKALSFDGVDDYVEVPDSASLDMTEVMTLAWWMYPKTTDLQRIFMKKRTDGVKDDYTNYAVWINDGVMETTAGEAAFAGQLLIDVGSGDGGTYTRIGTNVNVGNYLNEWHFYAFTYDESTLKVYVDGVLVYTLNVAQDLGANTGPLIIGKHVDNSATSKFFFNGTIDEVRIYNRALSENEIKMLYYNRIGAVPSKTI